MRERLVGLSHLVYVIALLDDASLTKERIHDFGGDGGGQTDCGAGYGSLP